MKRTVAAKAVAFVLLSLSAVSCGEQTSLKSDASPVVGSTAEIRANADELFARFYGTQAQRDAAELLVAHALNGTTARCMASEGYSWDWAQGKETAPPVDSLAASVWLGTPHLHVVSERLRRMAAFARVENVMNQPLPEAEQSSVVACRKENDGASDDEIDAIRMPELERGLVESWSKDIAGATASFGSMTDYNACMTAAELPVLKGVDFSNENAEIALSQAAPPPASIPVGDEDASSEWKKFLALEEPVVEADWACRSDKYDGAMRAIEPVLASFQSTHADQVVQMEEYWRTVTNDAALLGLKG